MKSVAFIATLILTLASALWSSSDGPLAVVADDSPTQTAAKPTLPATAKSGEPGATALLTAEDKELLAEALRLKQTLGDEVWPGLGSAPIPIIIYNDTYEFLTGPVNPAPLPPWAVVEKDDVLGQPYYRRPAQNPQAFAVDLGEQWAASMSSHEWMIRKTPFKLAPDFYVVLLLHEVFHAFQASLEAAHFRRSLALYALEREYPAKDAAFASAWTEEGALLAAALKAPDREATMDKVRAFLAERESRRGPIVFGIATADYEGQMEWLEGLGKYAEIRFYELAASRSSDPAFAAYKRGLSYWSWDFVRLEKQLGSQKGDLRFYLSGMAQARILDRLSPGWKVRFFRDGGTLEDRLQALVRGSSK